MKISTLHLSPNGKCNNYKKFVMHPSFQESTFFAISKIYTASMYGHTYSKSMDQPGKVACPACGQLNRKNEYFPVRVRA